MTIEHDDLRQLPGALEKAVGAAVDRERGWTDNGRAGGFGETLDGMAEQLRRDVEGPKGRD